MPRQVAGAGQKDTRGAQGAVKGAGSLGLGRQILGREDWVPLAQLSVERLPGLKSGRGHTLKAKRGRVWWYLDPDCHTDTRHPSL